MLGIGLPHRAIAAGLAAVAAAGCVSLAAGPAQASTATSCSDGFTVINSTGVTSFGCAGFVNNGAPYIFDLGTLIVDNFPFSPPLPMFSSYENAVATCSAFTQNSNGSISGTSCTFRD
jgi:hypothetical protein